jgi:hypothetical protein
MKQIRLTYDHDFTGVTPVVAVEVHGDDVGEVLSALMDIGSKLADTPPWIAKASLSELAKPITKKDVKKNPDLAGAQQKDEALRILTKTYSSPLTRNETKALLAKYEIKKFGDIALEDAAALLADAKSIEKNLPGEE